MKKIGFKTMKISVTFHCFLGILFCGLLLISFCNGGRIFGKIKIRLKIVYHKKHLLDIKNSFVFVPCVF